MTNLITKKEPKIISINDQLRIATSILKLAKQCYEYSVYLDVPNSEDEYGLIINSQSFRIFRVISARTAVIELAKLYGKKGNKYNFVSFINSIINGEHGRDFKQNPELIKWLSIFKDNEDRIKKIIALRDKAFAHTYLEYEIAALQSVVYNDVRDLIELAESFLSFVSNHFLNKPFEIKTKKNELEKNIRLILSAQSEENFYF